MSVYQVEQYYVHVDISGTTDLDKKRIKDCLVENNWDDHEFQEDCLVVDGFESDSDAGNCNELIMSYLDS